MSRPKLSEEEKMKRSEMTKQKNRERALKYYHEHKELKPKKSFTTLEEYMEYKKKYYQEYYMQHKKTGSD
jgi:hypothetical protein